MWLSRAARCVVRNIFANGVVVVKSGRAGTTVVECGGAGVFVRVAWRPWNETATPCAIAQRASLRQRAAGGSRGWHRSAVRADLRNTTTVVSGVSVMQLYYGHSIFYF